MKGVWGWSLVGLVAFAAACSLVTDLSPLLGGDASVDAPVVEAASDGFVLSTTPSHVTLDPGESIDVTIDIVRGATFTDIVDLTVNGVGGLSNVQTTPATLTFTTSAPVTLHIDVAATAKVPQDGALSLLGIGRTTQKPGTTSVGVRIGSVLLDTRTSTTVTVPPYANRLGIKAWGAGGGAGLSYTDSNQNIGVGGSGGGGGMAGAVFAVSPGATLKITVGAPGYSAQFGSAGSGGGYSEITLDNAPLLLAGAGGGGGKGGGDPSFCNAVGGGNAFAGGGANGEGTLRSATVNAGGPSGGTNATAGTTLQGGSGANPPTCKTCGGYTADGGAPGGGTAGYSSSCQGSAGGGGGGGWFGGGGGALTVAGGANGGGGGSGFVSDAGADVVQAHGIGATPAATSDPDFVVGSATGGYAQNSSSAAVPATAGRVVIRLPKP